MLCRFCPAGARYFSLLAKEKYPKERRPRRLGPHIHAGTLRASPCCALAELAGFAALSASKASSTGRLVCSQQGCGARPSLTVIKHNINLCVLCGDVFYLGVLVSLREVIFYNQSRLVRNNTYNAPAPPSRGVAELNASTSWCWRNQLFSRFFSTGAAWREP